LFKRNSKLLKEYEEKEFKFGSDLDQSNEFLERHPWD